MNCKAIGTVLLVVIVLVNNNFSNAQTIYGINGLIRVPDAYLIDNGKANLSLGSFKDNFYAGLDDSLYTQFAVNINIGFHPRFELGARLVAIPEIKVQDSTYRYDFYIDRTLNSKLILKKESRKLPQISIGFQDFIGTRYFNSTYLVMSKEFKLLGNDELTLVTTLGWGSKISNLLLGDAANHRLIGPFGGVNLNIKERGSIQFEYDGQVFGVGGIFQPFKWFAIRAFVTDFRYFGIITSLKFTL